MNKRIFVATIICVCATCFTVHQANAQSSGQANLTVDLSNVVALTVSSPNVAIPFNTATHYQSGNTATQNNHISITSTGSYTVKVKALSANLTDGSNNIPVSTIGITPTIASGGSPTLSNVSSLTTTNQTFATSSSGTLATVFNIQYAASGGTDYINKPAGNYDVTIEYTIEP